MDTMPLVTALGLAAWVVIAFSLSRAILKAQRCRDSHSSLRVWVLNQIDQDEAGT